MSQVLRALEGPIAPMICASDDPEHATRAIDRRAAPSTCCGSASATPSPRPSKPCPSPTLRPNARSASMTAKEPRRPRERPHDRLRPSPRHPRPAGRPGREAGPRDPPGHRPGRGAGRGPRDHGPQWLGQDDPRLCPDGSPRLRDQGRRGPLEGPQHPGPVAGQAVPPRDVPRVPVPDRDPRPERRLVHPERPQRQAPGHRQGRRHRPDRSGQGRRVHARLPQQDAREDGAPADGRGLRDPLRQRGVLGR